MIFTFTTDQLSRTLRGGLPNGLHWSAAAVSESDGLVYLEPSAHLPKAVVRGLAELGVGVATEHKGEARLIDCWLQSVPLTREPVGAAGPVLFELDGDRLAGLSAELGRLGCTGQSVRLDGDRAWLRVTDPPVYTLLRATEGGSVRAYRESSPRVWVEVGYGHPLADRIPVGDGSWLFVRPREWVTVGGGDFRPVGGGEFPLPVSGTRWAVVESRRSITVPLRLADGDPDAQPELWVLGDRDELDTFVADGDEKLVRRLQFALCAEGVVVRSLPGRGGPPQVVFDSATGYVPYWKLPNLYVPAGRKLHPTLRRDRVRELLAADGTVTWLVPGGPREFEPASVPESAFRSLEDWVDYVVESRPVSLSAWVNRNPFAFLPFVCVEDEPQPQPKPECEPKQKPERERATVAPKKKGRRKTKVEVVSPVVEIEAVTASAEPSALRVRRAELEQRFLADTGGLDSPERTALWPELAGVNTALGDHGEAAVCWLNALWTGDDPAWVRQWSFAESGVVGTGTFDNLLADTNPGQVEARRTVAAFLYLASEHPQLLDGRLPKVQQYLERFESAIPVRAQWLAAVRLSQLSDGDPLGLARTRDRLLGRLFEQGLSVERDLPGFLRFADSRDPERLRVLRDRSLELHKSVRRWTEHVPQNLPFVDLYFAWALAKLQETEPAKALVKAAGAEMDRPVPADWGDAKRFETAVSAITHGFLFRAYGYRVEQAGKGDATGQLSDTLNAELAELHRRGETGATNNPHKSAYYVIARLRDQSRVLEPHEKFDPYGEWTRGTDPLKKSLVELRSLEPNRLADAIRKLYRAEFKDKSAPEVRFAVLHESLPLAHRVGESFAAELIRLAPKALSEAGSGPESARRSGELLERSLFLAGHFGRGDLVTELAAEFLRSVRERSDAERFRLVNAVAGQCLRSLKKLGLRDEIDRFLTELQSVVAATPAELRKKYAAKPDLHAAALQTALALAGGWLHFDRADRAEPILDEARDRLFDGGCKFAPKDYPEVACAYVSAVGQGRSGAGLDRIAELYAKMDGKRITNTWTTSAFFSRFHLQLVETTVVALSGDEFAPGARKWLDEDEYLVRQRIHADLRQTLSGM